MDVGGDDISISATSFATSVGDHSMSIKEMARAERRAAKRARKELEMALANLPAPQFEYELAAPEAVTDDEDRMDVDGNVISGSVSVEKDAAEIEAEEFARLEKEAAELYAKRSSVVKRLDLPRPSGAIHKEMIFETTIGLGDDNGNDNDNDEEAEKLVGEEMLVLLQHDAFTHPYVNAEEEIDTKKTKKDKKGKKKGSGGGGSKKVPLVVPDIETAGPPDKAIEYIEEVALDMAKEMLEEEYEVVIQEKRRIVSDSGTRHGTFDSDDAVKDLLHQETIKGCCRNGIASTNTSIESMKTEYNAIQETINAMKKRTDKLESKISIKNGGYTKRSKLMQETISNDFAELQNSIIEEHVFRSLMRHEQRGMRSRIDKLQEETEDIEDVEGRLQKQYGDLLHERNRHKLLIRQKEVTGGVEAK